MKRTIESPQLHRLMPMKEAVEVEKMVATTVIMLVTVFPVTFIPDAFDLGEGCRFGLVHLVDQPGIHLLTIAHPLRFNL